jgi:hypothetical protein
MNLDIAKLLKSIQGFSMDQLKKVVAFTGTFKISEIQSAKSIRFTVQRSGIQSGST